MPIHSQWRRRFLHWSAVAANCILAALCPAPMYMASQADVSVPEARFAIIMALAVPAFAVLNLVSLSVRGRTRKGRALHFVFIAVNAGLVLAALTFAAAATAGRPYMGYPFSGRLLEAAPFVLVGLLTGLALLFRRSSPAESQTCASCGYSLIGLAAGHACPECGARRPEA